MNLLAANIGSIFILRYDHPAEIILYKRIKVIHLWADCITIVFCQKSNIVFSYFSTKSQEYIESFFYLMEYQIIKFSSTYLAICSELSQIV